jgi:hypothetical protein
MISKTYIKKLDFNTIEDIYLYIIDSEINGAYKQVKELINKLSTEQFKNFLIWFNQQDYKHININFFLNKRGGLNE